MAEREVTCIECGKKFIAKNSLAKYCNKNCNAIFQNRKNRKFYEKGGTHNMDNVRFVCANCNMTRPLDGSDVSEINYVH